MANKTITLTEFDGRSYSFADYATNEWKADHSEKIHSGLVVDIETTGTIPQLDQIIEIALVPFSFNSDDGAIIEIRTPYTSLMDLRENSDPLSEFVSQLTGLTEEDLLGQTIDWDKVNSLLREADIVIAHNAKYDRAFIDDQSLVSKCKIWGCSMSQIDWMEKGFRTKALELLCQRHLFYVGSHRALADAQATLHLITSTDSSTGKAYLHELLGNAKVPKVLLEATSAPFEKKDFLKSRHYRWNPQKKVWSKLITRPELVTEKEWLADKVYQNFPDNPATAYELALKDAFKAD